MKRSHLFVIPLLAAAWTAPSQGAAVLFRPSTILAAAGDDVLLDIYGTEFVDGTDGGDFAIAWSSNLSYVSFLVSDPPWDVSAFDATSALNGEIDFVDVFSIFATPGLGGGEFDIGTLTLHAIDVGSAFVGLGSSAVGWSLGGSPITVDRYGTATLEISPPISPPGPTPVPEPASVWLLGSALCVLGAMRRKAGRAAARTAVNLVLELLR